MGILNVITKPFKAIGKAFKWVGKQIMKGFNKLGKFMNKFGILGQVGMMFITGGISSAMFAGLKTLGTGFMAGLANSSSAIAQAAHKVLSGAVKLAKIPGNTVGTAVKETFGTITEAVGTTVTDTAKYIGRAMPGGEQLTAPDITGSIENTMGKLVENGGNIVTETKKAFTQSVGDASKFFKEADFSKLGYTPENKPIFAKFQQTNPETGELLFDKEGAPKMTTKEIAFDSKNFEAYARSRDATVTQDLIKSPLTPDQKFALESLDPEAFDTALESQKKTLQSQFIDKSIDSRVKEGLLQRSGSAMTDDIRQTMSGEELMSAGKTGIYQTLIPKRDLSEMGYGSPQAIQAYAQTDRTTQEIGAITGQQIRPREQYQMAFNAGTPESLDSFYDNILAGSETYNRFMNPSLKGNFEYA
tara:strand:+ start:3954 stop:5201 length:1248 start_codon:yes stop_codon:yes gene_type:complete